MSVKMVLTGRDPRMDRGDIAAMMLGTAIATAIILVRLKIRERRVRGPVDRSNRKFLNPTAIIS